MRKVIILCVLLAMSVVDAVAQRECNCDLCVRNVYYVLNVNDQEYRFDGKNASIAASLLQNATRTYFLNVEKAGGQQVHVYTLKGKKAYGIIVGGDCYIYYKNGSVVRTNALPDISGEVYSGGIKKGFVLGHNEQKGLLAIYEK